MSTPYMTLSEIITLCKQNMGVRDLPSPFTDEELKWRLEHSVLKEFNQLYPYKATFIIGEEDRICRPLAAFQTGRTQEFSNAYRIPERYYQNRHILDVTNVEVQRPNGYNDLYVPQGMMGDPAAIMAGMASIQMVGAMARTYTHSLTWEFKGPDTLLIYNGWVGGNYTVELDMSHDETLSTIPAGAFSVFYQLCELDLQQYFYMKLKRVQNLDLGIGSIDLKIDDWADAGTRKRELLDNLAETAALDDLHIMYW